MKTLTSLKTKENKNSRVARNFYFFIRGVRTAIDPSEIMYLQSNANYTKFILIGKRVTSSFTLKYFHDVLQHDPTFLRINRGILLNVNFMENMNWQQDLKEVKLLDGSTLPISRRRLFAIRESLNSSGKICA